MDKYHLLWVLRRLNARPKGPSFEQVLIPVTLALGLLVALLPAEFQDYAGIEKAVWEALVILGLFFSVVIAIVLLIMWGVCFVKNPPKTEEETYAEIVEQMAEDRDNLAAIEDQANRPPRRR